MPKHLRKNKAPVCLHILGQPLVNQVWEEGHELHKAVVDLLAHHRIKALDGVSDTLQPRLDRLRELTRDEPKIDSI
jgi:hypothetical protein